MNLTRAKFDELTADLVERTATPVQNALKDAGITASELSKVLVGWWFHTYPCCTGQSKTVDRT